MKKMSSLVFGMLLVLGCIVVQAAAQTRFERRNINHRQHHQQSRIAQGVRSGELTARETLRLERDELRLAQKEARFRASGDGLSLKERARLERNLNHVSREIYREKHDRQDRPRP